MSELFLSQAHRHMLEVESGIAPETIKQHGHWTCLDPAQLIVMGFSSSESDARLHRMKHASAVSATIRQHETAALVRVAIEVGIEGIAIRCVDGDWKTWHTRSTPPQGSESA